ncbi:MAG: hypothetical protein P8N49_08810 [Opitutales bacterium]|nr:hypothetical protein [Opitutales bacterium]
MSVIEYFTHGLFGPHSGNKKTLQTQLHWTLRITAALCFIGHGTWGLITKSGWLPFFMSQGIEPDIAWKLQPFIGAFDILMAILLLKGSSRAILIWMFLWALWTAALRPLAGNLEKVQVDGVWVVQLATDSMRVAKMQTWEFWERAGNWGPPFMLLIMGGTFALTRKDLLSAYNEPEIKESTIDTIFFLCKCCLTLLLLGHAGFGFAVEKQMLINHWQSIGVAADVEFITKVGYAEFALGVLIFVAPIRSLIFLALVWKIFTEFLYVPADTVSGMGLVNIFEWIERWGDYGIPVAMLYIASFKKGLANH